MDTSRISLIPWPREVVLDDGDFAVDGGTWILAPESETGIARKLANFFGEACGFEPPVKAGIGPEDNDGNCIALGIDSGEALLGEEGYTLLITPHGVEIRAPAPAGLFYGVQSLRQLLPLAREGGGQPNGEACLLPAVSIRDWPRFSWRGLHLDVGRHMFSVPFIEKFLDLMALHKLNVFHWHLTEDQGWRIEINSRPRLHRIGAWRAATPIPANRSQLDYRSYGGYYSQEEVRHVVAYARERFIQVLPEIEMPGHALAALAAYPELGCLGRGYAVATSWGIFDDVFCAGNEETYAFIEEVLGEVMALFPSEFIHIGGDECPKVRWQACPKCQAMIKREGLAGEAALQSYFVRRVERFLNAHGRRLIGWDEILEGGLAPNATVMSWRGSEGGVAASLAGHDVVMSPTTHCYFDYYQSKNTEAEPPAIGWYLPLETVFAFEPLEGIPADRQHHVLGGQANIWTEYIPVAEQLEYMAFPRASALAEVVWSGVEGRNYQSFAERLPGLLRRLAALQVNFRPLSVAE